MKKSKFLNNHYLDKKKPYIRLQFNLFNLTKRNICFFYLNNDVLLEKNFATGFIRVFYKGFLINLPFIKIFLL